MGKQGFREINENRERFANLCASTSGTQQHNQPTQMDTKGYLGVPRPDDQKPDQKSS